MKQGMGELVELYLESGQTGGRLLCSQNLIPEPGQYLLAHDGSDSPLPAPVFNAGSAPGGFWIAPPIPQTWQPGTTLLLRGPLGCGFALPSSARRVALVPLGETSARLKPLLAAALEQDASVVLVSDMDLPDLPHEVEIRPLTALREITPWADYVALDMPRESLPGLRQMLGLGEQARVQLEAQVLIVTPIPCGGVTIRHGWKLACKDGPVFDLQALI
jgi:hypothetical protein